MNSNKIKNIWIWTDESIKAEKKKSEKMVWINKK